jgi:outer membrane protein OmpA-like peptidoglycan-associated protein
MKCVKTYLITFGLIWTAALGAAQNDSIVPESADTVQSPFFSHVKLRTNLIWWLTATPNLGVEFPLGDDSRWSVGANIGYNPWKNQPWTGNGKLRHLLTALEVRRWTHPEALRPRSFDNIGKRSSFWGADIFYSHYNVGMLHLPFGISPSLREEYKQGDLVGLGLFGGYSWRIGRHFRLEAEAGLGWGYAKYKRHDCDGCLQGESKKNFLVPKLALNLVLDPLKRQKAAGTPQITEPAEVVEPVEPVKETPVPVTVPAPIAKPRYACVADSLAEIFPCVAHISEYRPYTPDRILRKEKGMLYVHFPVNESRIEDGFRDNSETLDRIVNLTRQIAADSGSEVKLIQIVGLASIEGSDTHNLGLSERRANALRDYIIARVPGIKADRFEVTGGGEAWTEFRDQVNDLRDSGQLSNSEIDEVLRIIDSVPDLQQREQQLKRLNRGSTYRKLTESTLMSDQRNSGYVHIYFDRTGQQK